MSLNLEVQILGEFKNLTKATKGATKQLQNFQGRVRGISRGINGALAAIGVGLSLNAVKNFFQGTINEASNLEESINAIRVSFGPASEAILAIGENSAKSFGVARSEFNQAAVSFSAFADEIVGPGGNAADFIGTITQRAADFASVFNIDVAEALRVFRSGLSGETEPLKRFGIILNDTAVKQFAYNNRIAETGTELTNTQKIQARYQLLLEETSKTQGDFANTAGSMANALRVARASFQDASASIGQGFTPAIAGVARFISNNIEVFNNLATAIGTKIKQAFDNSAVSSRNFGVQLINTLTQLTDFLNGTAKADNGFKKFADGFEDVQILLGGLGELFNGVRAVLDGIFNGLFGFFELFGVEIDGIGGLLRFLGEAFTNIGKFLQEFGNNIGIVISFFVPFSLGIKVATKTIEFLTFILGGLGKSLRGVGDWVATKGQQVAVWFAGVFGGSKKRIDATKKATDDLANTLPKLSRFQGINIDATLAAARAAAAAARQQKAYDKTLTATVDRIKNFAGNAKQADRELGALRTTLSQFDGKRFTASVDVKIGIDSSRPQLTDILFPKKGARGGSSGEDARLRRLKPDTALGLDTTTTGGTGDTPFQTRVKAIVAKLQQTLDEARERIKNASESFRDAVGLSFGVITNGFRAKFSVSRVIAQMNRIKAAVGSFSKDIIELRKKGADAALIDELIGLGPVAGSAAARSLVSSGQFDEFIGLRRDLATSGASVGAAGNLAINGTSTSGLTNAITLLNRTIAAGKGNTYNISIANPNITPQQIIAQIKAYEKTTGKKVFSN